MLLVAKVTSSDGKTRCIQRRKVTRLHPCAKIFLRCSTEKEFNTKTQSYGYSAFGYWFKHENKSFDSQNDKLGNYVVNIKTLEEQTGIDFFCNLPDDIEKQVEEMDVQAIKNIWGFK